MIDMMMSVTASGMSVFYYVISRTSPRPLYLLLMSARLGSGTLVILKS